MAFRPVIDLTQKAQKEKREAETPARFQEPDPALPPADPQTLPEPLRQGLEGVGWPGLMPVQERAIPYILDGKDLIVQARTGTGKTGAFLLPLLELLDPERKEAQALILGPTRELAQQILAEFERMNAGLPEERRLDAVAVYGGVGYGPQNEAFKRGAQIVVGTPGRVLDHLDRRTLRLDNLRVLILDEADEMLSMGFYPAMRKLKRFVPRERASYMFSATMPFKVQKVGEEFLREPGFLSLSASSVHVTGMEHRAYKVDPMQKDRALVRLLELENPDAAFIFSNTRREVEYVAAFLRNYGYDAAEISSDLTQNAREEVMGQIRRGELRFLVATDVAARGIDVTDLTHVFMYDIPQDREYYIHRAGRTARAGKTGVAVALVTPQDELALRDVATRYEIDFDWRPVPTDEEVAERVGERLVVLLEQRLRERTNLERERLRRFIPVVRRLVQEGEPELLAMLLDDVYHESLHAPEETKGPQERQEPAPKGEGPRGRPRRQD
jgi:ATP-dependent RNA helicase DeaD